MTLIEPSIKLADSLSRNTAVDEALAPAQNRTTRPGQPSVLLVDDEEHVTASLKVGLAAELDCQIATAGNGEQALALLERQQFDLMVTDYRMPGMNGGILSTIVRQRYPHTTIIVLTAVASGQLERALANIGVRQVILKPVKLEVMRQIVSTTLAETARARG